MIQASAATEYIATELNKLIQANQIKGKLEKSKSSVSIYLRTKDPNNPPPKYFRGSNHHPTLAKLLGHNWKPWKSKNINIEFAEPRRDENGEKIENRWNDRVKQNAKGTIKPFGIDVYEYKAVSLDEEDIPVIFGAIKVFVETGTYTDPFANTTKAARFIPRKANIIPRQPPTNISVDKNGNYVFANGDGADFVSESRMRNIIRETIDEYLERNVIRESMGISDEVDEIARHLYDMILKDLNQMTESDLCGWKFTKEKLRLDKIYDIYKTLPQDLIDYMHVVGRCYLEGDEPQFNEYGSHYDFVSNPYFTQMTIQMCVKYNPNTGTFELTNKFKTNLLSSIQHELMHGLQHRHRAINQTSAYINTAKDNYSYKEYKDIKEKIKRCYYYFTPFEIHANVQELYRQLYDANGDIEKCEIYNFYNARINDFNDLLKHRSELGGELTNRIVNAQLGEEMNFSKLQTHCKKGINKWQNGIRRVMRRYQLENNNEQSNQ